MGLPLGTPPLFSHKYQSAPPSRPSSLPCVNLITLRHGLRARPGLHCGLQHRVSKVEHVVELFASDPSYALVADDDIVYEDLVELIVGSRELASMFEQSMMKAATMGNDLNGQ